MLTAVAALSLVALASTAQAAVITASLDQTDVNGFPVAPFGTVKVTDITGGGVTVNVTLADKFSFVSTGNKSSFAFNLNVGIMASQITNILPANKYTVSLIDEPGTPFGNFSAALNVSAGNGNANAVPPPLDFTVTGITTANFVANVAKSGSYYFVADLVYVARPGANGITGSVATSSAIFSDNPPASVPVPEPASIALLGLGLALAGVIRSSRRTASGSNA